MIRKLFLFSGILSSILYFAMFTLIPLQWKEYSINSQTVSELSAIGAPTRSVWNLWGIFYDLLCIAFGIGVYLSGSNTKQLRITGILFIIYAVFGAFWPPMHSRMALAAGQHSMTDTLHIAWTVVTVPLMMAMIAFAATASGKSFRYFSILIILTQIIFGILTGIQSPNIELNLPTPWIGIWERIIIGAYLLWTAVLSIKLLRETNQ